ncbi:hypothetical protein GGTG_07144 [Gaeumannomyces tritici R3-111a-1]|uniref:Uncharacterized protein n=1 Tax=Gaeumannomyces tritici (strain R3-111a-1) TaxID=644352 RepID=J3P0U8_GAET3|nr:hypothetical protein GGTG_07144 [Gaeumannomyces tritici R3-111a-1]EJT77232.1 hypothetical protein GGTG_07144 [Gaeumannomyces tritici R3-111a-1]
MKLKAGVLCHSGISAPKARSHCFITHTNVPWPGVWNDARALVHDGADAPSPSPSTSRPKERCHVRGGTWPCPSVVRCMEHTTARRLGLFQSPTKRQVHMPQASQGYPGAASRRIAPDTRPKPSTATEQNQWHAHTTPPCRTKTPLAALSNAKQCRHR